MTAEPVVPGWLAAAAVIAAGTPRERSPIWISEGGAIERELTHEELREFTELLKTGFPGELIAAAFGPAGRQLR
jgi:hypothetical protein